MMIDDWASAWDDDFDDDDEWINELHEVHWMNDDVNDCFLTAPILLTTKPDLRL